MWDQIWKAGRAILLWIKRNPEKALELLDTGRTVVKKYTCNEPGCWRPTLDGQAYCEEHEPSGCAYVIVIGTVLGVIAGIVYWLW